MAHTAHNSRSLQAIFHVLLWVSVAAFIYRFIRMVTTPEAAMQIVSMRLGIFIVVFYFQSEFLIPAFLLRKKYLIYGIALAGTLSAATALRVVYERMYLLEELRSVPIYGDDMQIKVAFGAMLTMAVISFFYKMGRIQLQKEARSQDLIARQKEAENQLLRAQLNPHFLFNMLNNIYSLSINQSPKAPEMILKLSELLRYVTYKSQEELVLLRTEIQHIRLFIDIFQLKSPGPLPISFELEGDPGDLKTEPMLLLPLVENAFKHCDLDAEDAFLEICLKVRGQGFEFRTRNSTMPEGNPRDKQGGVGLDNIRKRLALREGGNCTLEANDLGGVFEVSLQYQTNGKIH